MKKKHRYSHAINIKISEQQYNDLKVIKENSGISISTLLRNNIAFLLSYYKPKAKT